MEKNTHYIQEVNMAIEIFQIKMMRNNPQKISEKNVIMQELLKARLDGGFIDDQILNANVKKGEKYGIL